MKIRCENCHSDFYFDPPTTGDPPLLTKCTLCEFPNPVPGSGFGSGEQGPVQYAQCFNCGRQMVHNPSQAIPICPDCLEGEEKTVITVKEWMIKKTSGQIYGPFDVETIQVWIDNEKISPKDEVSKVGGQWKKFETHPTFGRLFSAAAIAAANEAEANEPMAPVVAPMVKAVKAIKETSEKAIKQTNEVKAFKAKLNIDWGYWMGSTLAVCGLGAAILGSYALIRNQWLVVPEPWLTSGRELVQTHILTPIRNRGTTESLTLAEWEKLLTRLRQAHPDVNEPSSTLYARGRTEYLRDTERSVRLAQSLLEQSVVANPEDDLALTALAEVYATNDDGKRHQDALRLIEQADRLNPSAEVHRARAAFLVSTLHPDEARAEAEACLKLNPRDGEAEYYIGLSYLKTARDSSADALSHLRKAVELDPSLHKAFHKLGLVYLNNNEYRKAHAALQKKLSLDPHHGRALADMGRLYEEVGDLSKAVDLYEQASRASGDEDPLINLNLAVLLYEGRGQLARARALLQELTPLGKPPRLSLPDHKEALVHLAAVERLSGDSGRSLQTVERVLSIDSSFAPALFQKGLANLALGRLDEAGKALRAASGAESKPWVQSDIKLYVARVLTAQNKMKDAVDELEGAVDAYKPNLKARMALVAAHLLLQQPDEAMSSASEGGREDPLYVGKRAFRTVYFHNYPDLSPEMPFFQKLAQERFYVAETAANVGILYLQMGQRGAAVQAFQRALEVAADNVTSLLNLGILAQAQGDARGAIAYLNRLIDRDSQVGLAYVYLGLAYLDIGNLVDAEGAFQKAERYQRKNPSLFDGMGLLKVKQGKLEKAREHFLTALQLDPDFVPSRLHLFQYVP